MWTVVYMAQNKEAAEALQKLLEASGVLVKVRPINKAPEGEANVYEILVPQSEVEEAHNIIIDGGF
ncbi:MAG: hypothetical protein Q8882_02075 [Bacillota bacterium]|nr:hypothetical protein [Bacillota bacterium]